MQFWGLCPCFLSVVLSVALEWGVQQAPVETQGWKRIHVGGLLKQIPKHLSCITSYLLLFPWATSAPALRLRRRLGRAWLRRRLFGPTATHVCLSQRVWTSNSGQVTSWTRGGQEYQENRKHDGGALDNQTLNSHWVSMNKSTGNDHSEAFWKHKRGNKLSFGTESAMDRSLAVAWKHERGVQD